MNQPPLIVPDSVEMLNAEKHTQKNGVDLYILETNDFEVVRVSFVFKAGTSMQSTPFTASATVNMLSEGSKNMTAHQIAEKIDYYGSYFDVNIDRDYTYVTFCSLSKFIEPTLEVAEEVILNPIFPEGEIKTYCTKRKQQLTIERTKINIKAREAFAQSLFGEQHPYGVSAPTEGYDSLTREKIINFYNQFYCAENCFVVCSGNITDKEQSAIEQIIAKLPQGKRSSEVTFPATKSIPYRFIEHTDAVQSSLYLGKILFTRTHPDFLAMQVVTTLLGGYFGSRLMQNLREQRGYTYGVMAAMINFEKEGYLAIATQVGSEVTHDALAQIHNEIALLCTELVSEQELALVKNIMIGEMMRIIDGPFGIADVTIENTLCGRDNDVIEENVKRIQAITPQTILELSQKYLQKESLTTVIVGAKDEDFQKI